MHDSDYDEFVLAIAAMAATFRQEATEAVYEGYWRGLRDLPLDAVNAAVDRSMRECRWMPPVAELRERGGVVSPADRAVKAWGVVRQAVEHRGCYSSVNFDDPIVNAAVRSMGGWRDFDDRIRRDGETWVRKEFLATYEAYCRTGISHDPGGHLIGYTEYHLPRDHRPMKAADPIAIECGLPPHAPGTVPAITDTRKPSPRAIEFVQQQVADIGELERNA